MKQNAAILIVDDDRDILIASRLLLKRHFSDIHTCHQPEDIPELLSDNQYDAILLDMNFGPAESSGNQGYSWLKKIIKIDPQAVVIMITAHGGVDIAVKAMKLGATDFIAKPWQNEKVVATLSAAVQLRKSRAEAAELRDTNKALAQASTNPVGNQLLGKSPALTRILSLIQRTAPTDANVLLLGENGTGKELVAREIHRQSRRANQIFMSIDLGSITETLFESEMFGYKKGAFTGAKEDRVGRLKAANRGTLFLDEIGNLPLHLQAKLLTVLEQRVVTPIGANSATPFDVRIISATNLSKQQLTSEDKFRQDLLFRLNTVEICLPPLRDRAEDIEMIAQHYLNFYAKKYNVDNKKLSANALKAINQYAWPGNVRALRHAIERAIILSDNNLLEPIDFQLDYHPAESSQSNAAVNDSTNEDLNLERVEKKVIEQALKKNRYNISHSAKELGLTRAALYRRMEKHGL